MNEISIKNLEIDIETLYSNWTKYCISYGLMNQLYISYSYSNTIIYFKNSGFSGNKIGNMKEKILKETLLYNTNEDYIRISNLIDEYVVRNKFVNIQKYVN